MKTLGIYVCLTFLFNLTLSAQVLNQEQEEKEPVMEKKPEKLKEDDGYKTVFKKDGHNGFYFDLYFNYTEIRNENAFEGGTRLSFIAKHALAIGLEGSGYVTDTFKDTYGDYIVAGGHGGITIEPILFPKFPVHVTFPLFLGGGAAVYTLIENNDVHSSVYVEEIEGYLLARPGMEVELNVTRYFRFCLNASYRFVSELELAKDVRYVQAADLNGFSFGASFKFGLF